MEVEAPEVDFAREEGIGEVEEEDEIWVRCLAGIVVREDVVDGRWSEMDEGGNV